MNITFDSRELREVCEVAAESDRLLGERSAALFRETLADLQAAPTLGDLPFRPQELGQVGGRHGFALSYGEDGAIVFLEVHRKAPLDDDGVFDWRLVSRVKIVQVGAHGDG